jgi:hypothetical protein
MLDETPTLISHFLRALFSALRSPQKNTALTGGIFLRWWRRRESPGLRACKRESAHRHAACGVNSLFAPRPAGSVLTTFDHLKKIPPLQAAFF